MTERTTPDDPRRCKAPVSNGQCPYKAEPGTDYCSNHDGGRQLALSERKNYLQSRAGHLERLGELNRPELLRSLDDEIAANMLLLKLTMERTQGDPKELILKRGEIVSLTKNLADLKKINAELQRKYRQVLSVAAVSRLASALAQIALDAISDLPDFETRADQILSQISAELKKNHNEEGEL